MIVYQTDRNLTGTIGGKAAGLFRLQALSVAVPPFLVIAAETFDISLLIDPKQVTTEISQITDQNRQVLLEFALPDSDRAIIERALANWGFPGRAVVVRSSVADEDGTTDAFAGLMDSFLNLTTLADVYAAVSRCAASAWSDRAMAYRQLKNLSLHPRPAVIIQQQVTPTASGVMFTTFPDYPPELAIHATYGFGEGLVSGQLDADEFYWLKATARPHRERIARKPQALAASEKSGLYLTAIPSDIQTIPCLTDEQSAELFGIGIMLETALGHPQDVEFVVADDRVWVVQTRPVTQPISEVIVYDNANIQESYCGVTTPLTFSFASRAYATVYRQTMHTLGLPRATIAAQEDVVTNLLGLVKGRIYYHINNWYRGLLLLPSFGQNKADMERMMGLTEPVSLVMDQRKTTVEKLRLLPGLLVNLARLLLAFGQLRQRVPAFHARFRQHYDRFYRQALGSLTYSDLLAEKTNLDQNLLDNWTTPIINDFYVMMTNGQVVRQLQRAGIADPDEFLSRYLSGDAQIDSTQPVRAMYRLAVEARAQPDLRSLILTTPAGIHEQVSRLFPAFYQSVNQFIDQYGDRTVGELKLETVTMRVAPIVFYQYLANYLRPNAPTDPLTGSNHLHTEAAQELTTRLASQSRLFRWQTRRTLARLQRAIRYREALRLERTRLFGMYRAVYLALGNALTNSRLLDESKDVFYLTEGEIMAQPLPNSPFKPLITYRKQEFANYEQDDVPGRVTLPPDPALPVPTGPTTPGELRGTGCTPGVVTGEVVVILKPGDGLDVTGRIVCALRTDPGWAVLFPMCRAVLIERGSSLSHSVILLRELGLPTIINIPGLTKTLCTGQTITMDGSTGRIIIQPDHD